MANSILTRGTYTASATGTANQSTRCELFIWNSPSTAPGTPTHILSKPIPSSNQTTVYYNISPYIRNFINHTIYVEPAAAAPIAVPVNEYCFARVDMYVNETLSYSSSFICFDGYTLYDTTRNPIMTGASVMLDEGSYVTGIEDDMGSIYVYTSNTGTPWTVTYNKLSDGTLLHSDTFSFNMAKIPWKFFENPNTPVITRIYNGGGVLQKTFTMLVEEPCKHGVTKLDFKNRYGMWQRLNFFGANRTSMQGSRSKYNLMPNSLPYDSTLGTTQSFNANGRDSIILNTGWVPESYDLVIEQMLLSDTFRLDDKPVQPITESVNKMKHINEQLINYEIQFEYAYDIINTII